MFDMLHDTRAYVYMGVIETKRSDLSCQGFKCFLLWVFITRCHSLWSGYWWLI